MMTRLATIISTAASLLLVTLGPAGAQNYPARAITIVVPFPAGGLTDLPVRVLAQIMQKNLKVPVVVENKTGASGVIGANYVRHAEPDGYTLLADSVADTQNLYYMKIPYNAAKDFTYIAEIADGPPLVMVVNTKVPYKTVADVVAAAKKKPISFGTSGYATSPFIALKELNAEAGTSIQAVPFHGAGDLTGALLSGSVQGMFYAFSSTKALVDNGSVHRIAVAALKRIPAWKDVPTMQESGFPGFNYNGFVGLVAPAHTPPAIVATLNKAVNEAIHTEEYQTHVKTLGMSVPAAVDNTPEKFHASFEALTARAGKVAKAILAKGDAKPPAK